MILSNRKCVGNLERNSSGDLELSFKVDVSLDIYKLKCKLNQYPTNLTLQNLFMYFRWGISKKFELSKIVEEVSYEGAENIEKILEEKRKLMASTDFVSFNVDSENSLDYRDPEIKNISLDRRKDILFDYIGVEIENPNKGEITKGEICLIDSEITLDIDVKNNKFTLYLGLETMRQDMNNNDLYLKIMNLPTGVFGENNGLRYLILESDGVESTFLDVLRNYLGDEFSRLVLETI